MQLLAGGFSTCLPLPSQPSSVIAGCVCVRTRMCMCLHVSACVCLLWSGESVISLVLSHRSKHLKQWRGQCYRCFIWQAKKNTSSKPQGGPTQKMLREERPGARFWRLFFCSPPPSLPCVNWVGQEGWTFLCSIFQGFSHLCPLATAILDYSFLFWLPNTLVSLDL